MYSGAIIVPKVHKNAPPMNKVPGFTHKILEVEYSHILKNFQGILTDFVLV